jgi:2,4-dienoyl-CoA reductase-like NADH-dependent reductase (Old Yellow Enzyme family)
LELYSKWSAYDWGMIFTGNVQVSPQHLCLARDLVLPREISEENLKPFRELAAAMHGEREERPMAIMQLSHAGRQSPNIVGGRFPFVPPLGPSSIRLGSSLKHDGSLSDLLHRIMFQIPRSMSLDDIDEVVSAFVSGARLAFQTGYDGVEFHVAHGCEFMHLSASFISRFTFQTFLHSLYRQRYLVGFMFENFIEITPYSPIHGQTTTHALRKMPCDSCIAL